MKNVRLKRHKLTVALIGWLVATCFVGALLGGGTAFLIMAFVCLIIFVLLVFNVLKSLLSAWEKEQS